MNVFYINEPVVSMREAPNAASKVVSQTILAEEVQVQQQQGEWAEITTPDGYAGWIPSSSIVSCSEAFQADLSTTRLAAHVYGINDTEFGPLKTVPFGTKLKKIDAIDARWIKAVLPDGLECFIQKGDLAIDLTPQSKEDLVAFSQKFLGLPYTWGGRSSFGYDCSGFTQMLYSQINIHLQRDARQQILDPRLRSVAFEQLQPGDLVFFGKSEQRVMHVGLYIGNGQFIHATAREYKPWIRISNLTDFEWSGHPEAYYPYRTAKQLSE